MPCLRACLFRQRSGVPALPLLGKGWGRGLELYQVKERPPTATRSLSVFLPIQEKEQRPSFAAAGAGLGVGPAPASGLGFTSAGPANQQDGAAEDEEESVLPTAFGAR